MKSKPIRAFAPHPPAFGILHSAFLLAATAVLPPPATAATLFDFETDAERAMVETSSKKGWTVGVTNAFATSGGHAMRVECETWGEGKPEYPSLTLRDLPVTDWSGYDRLVLDLVNVGAGGHPLTAWICGEEGRDGFGLAATVSLPENGYLRWTIPLRNWPNTVSPKSIGRICLKTANFTGRTFTLMVDRVMLLKEGEELPEPDSSCFARDIAPLIAADAAGQGGRAAEAAHLADLGRFRDRCRAAGQSARMLLGCATSMEKVFPRGAVSARPLSKDGLAVRLARNEFEGVQLVVVSGGGGGLKGVKVQVADDLNLMQNAECRMRNDAAGASRPSNGQTDKTSSRFAATNIACDVVGFVRIDTLPPHRCARTEKADGAPDYARRTCDVQLGWWPDPLLGFMECVDIAENDVQSFWIRVRCPEGQRAGLYRGELVVSAEGVDDVREPLAVRVNDFSLERVAPLPVAVTFAPNVEGGTGMPGGMDRAALDALRRNPEGPIAKWRRHAPEWTDFLADYLISYDSLYHGGDTNRLERVRQLRDEGRLGCVNVGYWFCPQSDKPADMTKWRDSTLPRLMKFYEGLRALGVADHAYAYGCDEATEARFPAVRAAALEVRKALPGVPLLTTALDYASGVGSALDEIDWFCPITWKYNPDAVAKSRAAGHKAWWYVCCGPKPPWANMFVEGQAIEPRMLMGAQAVRMKPDGFLYYQASIWNSPRCIESGPFTDWDVSSFPPWHGDGQWTCAGPGGTPLPTIRLENFRDGLEDYAYAKLLERKLKELGEDCSQMTTNANCSQIANTNNNLPSSSTPSLPEAQATAPNQPSNRQTVKPSNRASWAQRAREALAVPREVMDSMTNYTDDPAVLYRWRDEMADLIEYMP